MTSLPREVCLCRSSVPGAEFGVCTRRHIPAGTWIGPFEGKRVQPSNVKAGMDTSFMWEVGAHYSEIKISGGRTISNKQLDYEIEISIA